MEILESGMDVVELWSEKLLDDDNLFIVLALFGVKFDVLPNDVDKSVIGVVLIVKSLSFGLLDTINNLPRVFRLRVFGNVFFLDGDNGEKLDCERIFANCFLRV